MAKVRCEKRLEVIALEGVPRARAGDDVTRLCLDALRGSELTLQDGDVLVVTSKLLSRAQNRFVDLATIVPSKEAEALAREIDKDSRVVELILRQSHSVSRKAKGVLIVRHELGFVSANAGIDMSNAQPHDGRVGQGPWALLLPERPDDDARKLCDALGSAFSAQIGVVISDSHGRPFRVGTVGLALGVAGVPAVHDQVGAPDLDGRRLEHTVTALADQIAATADLVAGQADEGRPLVLVRGLSFMPVASSASQLLRPVDQDLYL